MERVYRQAHDVDRVSARRPDTSTRPVDPPLFIQPKLEVGAANDPDEREADRVAEQIVAVLQRQSSGSASGLPTSTHGSGRVRRSTVAGGTQSRAAGESIASTISGVGRIRRSSAVVGAEGGVVGGEIESRIRRSGEGRALDAGVRTQMEGAFGTDFSNVRVHTDSDIAPMIGAHAFTHGSDVHIARGNYQPDSAAGQRLLAHELTHVVQQGGGARRASRVSRLVAPADPKKAQKRFNAARAEQTKARTKLAQMVQEGMTQTTDQRLKNACEWVNSGRAKLYAVTRTGDSNERVTEEGADPKDTSAWFPAGTDVTQPGHLLLPQWNYDWYDLENNANIEFDDNTTGGWNLPGIVAIVNPHKKSKKEIWETIKHEVQHDSDRNIDKKNEVRTAAMAGGLTKAEAEQTPAYKLVRYKTEYRAYNYEGGGYDKYSPTKIVTKAGYQWTERQYAIFNHIYGAYTHTETGWDDDLSVGGGITFRQAVLAYRDPDSEGFNKWDSIRIDELYNEIFALADNTSDYIDMAIVHEIPEKIRALTPAEARYVVQESPDWDRLIQRKLSDIPYGMIMDRLRDQAGISRRR